MTINSKIKTGSSDFAEKRKRLQHRIPSDGPVFLFGEIMAKICSTCKKEKNIDEFHKNKTKKDGMAYQCKACKKLYEQSEAGKRAHRKYNRKYNKTEKGKAANQISIQKYIQSAHGKLTRETYRNNNPHKISLNHLLYDDNHFHNLFYVYLPNHLEARFYSLYS